MITCVDVFIVSGCECVRSINAELEKDNLFCMSNLVKLLIDKIDFLFILRLIETIQMCGFGPTGLAFNNILTEDYAYGF